CVRPRKINSANVRMKLRQLDLVAIRIGQQRYVARALDCGRQLTLITRLRPCDTAGNDFTGFGNVAFQSLDIFVIDLFYTFCAEAAELATAKETCHDLILFSNLNLTMELSCDRTRQSRRSQPRHQHRWRGRLQSKSDDLRDLHDLRGHHALRDHRWPSSSGTLQSQPRHDG